MHFILNSQLYFVNYFLGLSLTSSYIGNVDDLYQILGKFPVDSSEYFKNETFLITCTVPLSTKKVIRYFYLKYLVAHDYIFLYRKYDHKVSLVTYRLIVNILRSKLKWPVAQCISILN